MMQYYKEAMEVRCPLLPHPQKNKFAHRQLWFGGFRVLNWFYPCCTIYKVSCGPAIVLVVVDHHNIKSSWPRKQLIFLLAGKPLLAAPRARPHASAGQLHHNWQQPGHRDQPIQLPHWCKYTVYNINLYWLASIDISWAPSKYLYRLDFQLIWCAANFSSMITNQSQNLKDVSAPGVPIRA